MVIFNSAFNISFIPRNNYWKKLLDKSNDVLFKKILKIVILILGSKLIFDSINIYVSL